MLTFFHAPQSRSSAVLALIEEMGIRDRIAMRIVDIARVDGTGGFDPANPHPEHKAPVLSHEGRIITERGAVMTYLTTLFPEADLAPRVGTPDWGAFLTWMTWYGSVMEPVLILDAAEVSHPWMTAAIRGPAEVAARLHAALERGPWLLGEHYSAADLLCHSPYAWFRDATPDDPLIKDWVARCQARPALQRAKALDADWMKARLAA